MNRGRFKQLVKEALMHLHDLAYLQLHPLGQALPTAALVERGGIGLQRFLLDALNALQPESSLPPTDRSWRPYQALHLRYVKGTGIDEVEAQLGLSPRQLRREHARGIEALADLIWSRYLTELPDSESVTEVTDLPAGEALASEVKRLGAAAPTAHSTSLPTTLESVIATLADLEVWQYFQLDLQLPPDLPAVMIERVILRQILLNVLSHFLVIGRRGRIEISASVSGDQLTLSVGYQGQVKPDIPADGEDHRLAVATRLAQVQAGELLISDDETTIRLSLPVEQQATVLVVDDNPDLIQLFRRYLTNSPFRLVGVSSSRQALSTAQKVTPQVIILDVMMPTQDGWELLQYLKNHPATHHIPVIICSVLKERELALSLGAQAFLAKPVSRQMLLTALGPYKSGRPVGAHPTRLADSASSRPPKNPLAW